MAVKSYHSWLLRIHDVRPGCGYAGLEDRHAGDLAPGDSGVFHIDLETGESELIISLAAIFASSCPTGTRRTSSGATGRTFSSSR